MRLSTSSPEETISLGERLGRLLRGLDLVLLVGGLGSGKTTFVRGLARGAGYRGRVMSPTFGLARDYRSKRLTVHHLDLYRLGPGELGDVGLEEFTRDPKGACVVEWPGSGSAYWPADRLEIGFETDGEAARRLRFEAKGPRSRALLSSFRKS